MYVTVDRPGGRSLYSSIAFRVSYYIGQSVSAHKATGDIGG